MTREALRARALEALGDDALCAVWDRDALRIGTLDVERSRARLADPEATLLRFGSSAWWAADLELEGSPLVRAHQTLSRTFSLALEAVLDRRVGPAIRLFRGFAEALAGHAAREESGLLVAYRERVPAPPRGGAADVFFAEHGRVFEYVRELEGLFDGLRKDASNPAVLHLIDRAFRLRGVLEHHELREETVLLPELQAAAPELVVGLLEGFELVAF